MTIRVLSATTSGDSIYTQPQTVGDVAGGDRQIVVAFLHGEDPTSAIKAGLRRGFTFITSTDLADGLAGRRTLPHKCFLLQYDDGHSLQYNTIHPIIQSFGVKATLNLCTGFIDQTSINPVLAAYLGGIPMSWNDVQAMYSSGLWDIQCHTDQHYSLSSQNQSQRAAALNTANDRIETMLGYRPKTIAYPFGQFPYALVDELPGLGMELGFTINTILSSLEPSFASETRFTLNRLNDGTGTALDGYYDNLIYNYERDRNVAFNYPSNANTYWAAIPTGGSWTEGAGAYDLILDSTSNANAASWITSDYYRVHGGAKIAYRFWAQMTSQNAGNGGIRLVQYDGAKVALGSPNATIKNWTAADAGVFYNDEIILDDAARFVKLEVYADASCNGKIDIGRLRVMVA